MVPGNATCGELVGTQLLVRDCVNSKTCPRNNDPDCTDVLNCSSLFKFESCDIDCADDKVSKVYDSKHHFIKLAIILLRFKLETKNLL